MNRLYRALVCLLTARSLESRSRSRGWRLWAVALAAASVVAVLAFRDPPEDGASPGEDADKDGRAILGRLWFDKLPESSRDSVHLWLWLGGGVGLHESGSRYRFNLELFDFERAGSKVDMRYFQDGKRIQTGFKIERCDDLPPFDLCLALDEAPGDGPRKLYGFDYDNDLNDNIPWAMPARRAAEELARAPRP